MSTAQRRRGKSLHLELPGGSPDERPPIVALFLIQFDVKAGYTIAWKQSIAGLELAESVEFKSLPSGLHNVKDDLVYFIHDGDHAGISAFINKTTDKWERNALMLAVGALVPLDQGRLGRSWKHAENLKDLAKQLVQDPSKTAPLEEYWANNHFTDETSPSSSRPGSSQASTIDIGRGRRRKSMASGTGISFGLSPYHPALALPSLVDSLGPLIFPLYKSALLRKKILLMHEAPVELACKFVYNISILSNIPSSVADLIPLEPLPSRLQPLFSVGIHDIDDLSRKNYSKDSTDDPEYGWVACSTDDVLTVKTDIYDILINFPPSYSKQAREKTWPRMKNAAGQDLKASQRDFRRYRTLRRSIQRQFPSIRSPSPYNNRRRNSKDTAVDTVDDDNDTEQAALLGPLVNTHETFDDASSTTDEQLIEPLSWSALAYNSFIWWASAGERRVGLEEEVERDAAMFRDFNSSYADTPERPRSSGNVMTAGTNIAASGLLTDGSSAAPEMAIIAYFHRLTATILGTLAQLVERSEESGEGSEEAQQADNVGGGDGAEAKDGVNRPPVFVGSEDMVRMGLDVWSDADKKFVEELLDLYWGRKADVQGGHIECCGVRIL